MSEKTDTVVNVKSLSMSRSDKQEDFSSELNFDYVENCELYDEQGKTVRFGDLYKDQKTIIIFIRHFLCFMCKEYVDDLAIIPEKYLKEANVRLVVIGCSPWRFIKAFRYATVYRYDLYVDPERVLYKKLHLKEKIESLGKTKDSKHVKSNFVSGVLKSTWRGMEFRELQGDIHQQGGSFVIGPGNVVHFAHADTNGADHTPINDLLAVAGVHQVNFPKDARVELL